MESAESKGSRKEKERMTKAAGITQDTANFNDNPIIKLFREIELM